jgi:hypothetical protein
VQHTDRMLFPQKYDDSLTEALVSNSAHSLLRGLEQLLVRVERIMERYPLRACESYGGTGDSYAPMDETSAHVSNGLRKAG